MPTPRHDELPTTAGDQVEKVYTEPEVAELLRVSQRTVWSLRQAGQLRCIKIGRHVRYTAQDVRDYIEQQRQGK